MSLDQQSSGIDSYLTVLESAKEKRDVQKRSILYHAPPSSCHLVYIKVFMLVSYVLTHYLLISCSKYNIADGMRQMFDPFERVARAHHVCPCCERSFSAEEEDDFVKKVLRFYHCILM